jgi:hypothetical protein
MLERKLALVTALRAEDEARLDHIATLRREQLERLGGVPTAVGV